MVIQTLFHPLSEDAIAGTIPLVEMAKVIARVNEPDLACDLIDQLMSIPPSLTTHDLRFSPEWDTLLDHPFFQTLLEK